MTVKRVSIGDLEDITAAQLKQLLAESDAANPIYVLVAGDTVALTLWGYTTSKVITNCAVRGYVDYRFEQSGAQG